MIVQSKPPVIVKELIAECPEMMFVQYIPIRIPDIGASVPKNLIWCREILLHSMEDFESIYEGDLDKIYIYLTAKYMWVNAGTVPNRYGWHIDGFGTNDVNYIWSDRVPTLFCIQDFDLSDDHAKSMEQMSIQANPRNIETYGNNKLIRLDQTNVHTPGVVSKDEEGFRTFVKVSFSKHKYNLKGNAHNYMLSYDWQMYERGATRNHPIKEEIS